MTSGTKSKRLRCHAVIRRRFRDTLTFQYPRNETVNVSFFFLSSPRYSNLYTPTDSSAPPTPTRFSRKFDSELFPNSFSRRFRVLRTSIGVPYIHNRSNPVRRRRRGNVGKNKNKKKETRFVRADEIVFHKLHTESG